MFRLPKLKAVPSINAVLVGDEDEITFTITHPKHLSFFASPLADSRDLASHARAQPELAHKESRHTVTERTGSSSSTSSHEKAKYQDDPEEPVLKRAHEASTIQLFYDLFFVANLTTFTGVHEIDDADTLKSYIGFFGILWFTWFQVALFDVRFSNDSAFERLCKALQFGIMVGFAIVGPNYKTGWEDGSSEAAAALSAFQTLSLILMASRFILAVQYTAAYCWLLGYKKAHLPLLAHIGTLFIAAMIYLGLYFSFGIAVSDSGLIAWYVTLAFESIVLLGVSARARFMSLRRTAIIERLGLLTLIILGEGIIGLCGSVVKVGSDGAFTSDVVGMVISSVCIIYFLWMLYFDQEETNHVGTIRQNFWAVLHFPLHVTILLTVEGLSRLSIWVKVLDVLTPFSETFQLVLSNSSFNPNITTGGPTGSYLTSLVDTYNETTIKLFERFPSSQYEAPDITEFLETLKKSEGNSTAFSNAAVSIYDAGFEWVTENFGIEPPESSLKNGNAIEGIFTLFYTIFLYFFLAAGGALVILAVLYWIGKRRKLRGEVISIGFRIVIGTGLCLLALMGLPVFQNQDNSAINTFLYSPWVLPTVVLSYALVVCVDNLLINYVRKTILGKPKITKDMIGRVV